MAGSFRGAIQIRWARLALRNIFQGLLSDEECEMFASSFVELPCSFEPSMIFVGCYKITLRPVLTQSQRDFMSADGWVREGWREGD